MRPPPPPPPRRRILFVVAVLFCVGLAAVAAPWQGSMTTVIVVDPPRRPVADAVKRDATAAVLSDPVRIVRVEEPAADAYVMPEWRVPIPTTLDNADRDYWFTIERPYGGCHIGPDLRNCTYPSASGRYQVVHNASVLWEDLGGCSGHAVLPVQVWHNAVCDERIFVPLRFAESLYFGHFDQLMAKLNHALVREAEASPRRKILIYCDDHFTNSANVFVALRQLGVEVTTAFPKNTCFHKVVWTCFAPGFEINAAKRSNQLLLNAAWPEAAKEVLPQPQCRRIFFRRTARTAQNGRPMPKEEWVAEYLVAKYGFCLVYGNESLQHIQALMRGADIVVASHGGALMNILWMDPSRHPAVVELDGYKRPALFWLNAVSLGFKYAWMSYDPAAASVDIERVERLIRTVANLTEERVVRTKV